MKIGDTSTLTYEVTNNSANYDAEVKVTCVPSMGTTAKYTSIKNELKENTLLTKKVMYCYNCQESSEESTKTISTTCTSATPTSACAKSGNGYARITLISTY